MPQPMFRPPEQPVGPPAIVKRQQDHRKKRSILLMNRYFTFPGAALAFCAAGPRNPALELTAMIRRSFEMDVMTKKLDILDVGVSLVIGPSAPKPLHDFGPSSQAEARKTGRIARYVEAACFDELCVVTP